MKTMRKKISLLLVLSAVLFLSSCLDSGDNSYIGNNEFSYITRTDNGTVYARTLAGYFITSPKISIYSPGTAALLTYQITEETETIVETVSNGEKITIHKVNLGGEPVELEQSVLQNMEAPDTDTVYFESPLIIQTWVPNYSAYFEDRWPIEFQYKSKKGESVKVNFYKVAEDKLPENLNADVLIDVRLKKTGTPESGASEELKNGLIVANMSMLRQTPGEVDNQETKPLRIKFRYFRSDKKDELHISDQSITITVQK